MRLIFKIARAELCKLFSSPVAWLILFVFAIQFGVQFCGILIRPVKDQALGNPWYSLTSEVFWNRFSYIRGYLYFYIPLLTMGLMSREYGSGSIKLLFSSPVTNFQIIWGKYLSMMLFGLFMLGMLVPYVVFTACVVENMDYGYLFSNFLGLYLLICAYAAVGLFMSALTSNQVVAAIGTLAVLSFLSLIGKVGSDVSVVQDITYWLSFSKKSRYFTDGLVCSENVIYFLTVIGFFLTLTFWRIKRMRMKQRFSCVLLKYAGLFMVTILIGYVASRPACIFYWDMTYKKSNTVSPVTQELIAALDGELKLVTYVNVLGGFCDRGLPANHTSHAEDFRKYIRFKPDLKMEYVYYYDGTGDARLDDLYPGMTDRERAEKICRAKKLDFSRVLPPEELYRRIDLSEEKGRLVYQFVWKDSTAAFLRLFDDNRIIPSEREVAVAFKRLLSGPVRAGFLTGHGERGLRHTGDAGYNRFSTARTVRQALINQGYDIFELQLETAEVPGNTDVVVVADPQKSLSDRELDALSDYLQQGGNMLVLGEPDRQAVLNPLLNEVGIHLSGGRLTRQCNGESSDVIASGLTVEAARAFPWFGGLYQSGLQAVMAGCAGLVVNDKGFDYLPLVRTNISDTRNEEEAEVLSYPVLVGLQRMVGGRQQRIVVGGDADWLSNGELFRTRDGFSNGNFRLQQGIFRWLCQEKYPVELTYKQPIDNHISLRQRDVARVKMVALGGYPLIILLFFVVYRSRRKRK